MGMDEQVVEYGNADALFEALRVEWGRDPTGYRGQSQQRWSLVPKLTRSKPRTNDQWFDIELDLFRDFKKETQRYFGALERAHLLQQENHLQIQSAAVMQHYCGPTRLLDWSYSPFVALFFAAIDDHNDDGCVWSFPWKRRGGGQ